MKAGIAYTIVYWTAFAVALIAPIAVLYVLCERIARCKLRTRGTALCAFALLLTILAHPIAQGFFLESLDTQLNLRWDHRAREIGLVGKTPEEVRSAFGEPDYTWEQKAIAGSAEGDTLPVGGYVAWEYKPFPGYWLGSYFQVFFEDGVVKGFEANDD